MTTTTVAWFSSGVSSAVATKLIINEVDRIIYTHIDDQHPDTLRFVKDCEQWFGKPVDIIQSPLKSVKNACLSLGKGYINGPSGAACMRQLKRLVRKRWEYEQPWDMKLRYVWGMDYQEQKRCSSLVEHMPKQEHIFPLVDRKLSKEQAHKILTASGINRPAMYDLGYQNNNCIGCVRGGMAYWNRIRKDFPEIFRDRAEMERKIGATCINGKYLDELDPFSGRDKLPIVGDCGIMCEVLAI